MTYAEDCAGISASCVAWEPLGWTCAWATEIEKFPVAVLKERHPSVKLLGDMTKVNAQDHEPIDLLIGGTPCQGFSVAGFRAGLADPRSNLALAFLRHVDQARPRWVVWENVPGVYSSGDDFGSFLWGLSELGYGYAYRTLDAQYFGVPQRRRRVFVIGYLGDWRPAAAVLFERACLLGNPPPRRETGQGVAKCVTSRFGSGRNDPTAEEYLTASTGDTSHCLNAGGMWRLDFETETFVCDMRGNGDGETVNCLTGDHASRPTDYTPIIFQGGQGAKASMPISDTTAGTLKAATGTQIQNVFTPWDQQSKRITNPDGVAPTLSGADDAGGRHGPITMIKSSVRRLTPRECERLQGFPDDYTLITYRGKPAADGPRCKALGNSIAVPVLHWKGQRIELVESIIKNLP